MFDKRLKLLNVETQPISITINVEITNKKYGPFKIKIPKLSKRDMYKFMLYTLLNSNFTVLSGEYITKIGAKIVYYKKKRVMKQRMGSLKLESYLLKNQDVKSYSKNTCVVDYVWSQVGN